MNSSDVVAIQQVINLYGHAVDRRGATLLGQVFTEDGVFDGTPGGVGWYQRLDTLVGWFELGAPTHPPFHIGTNAYVYESNGEVKALSKWLITNPRNGTVWSGDYEDTMVRTPSGRRIRERVCTVRSVDSEVAAKVASRAP